MDNYQKALQKQKIQKLITQVNAQAKNIEDLAEAYESIKKEKGHLIQHNNKLCEELEKERAMISKFRVIIKRLKGEIL